MFLRGEDGEGRDAIFATLNTYERASHNVCALLQISRGGKLFMPFHRVEQGNHDNGIEYL